MNYIFISEIGHHVDSFHNGKHIYILGCKCNARHKITHYSLGGGGPEYHRPEQYLLHPQANLESLV